MPDGPTVGGYPKPAVVASVDLPRLAQCPVGAAVRFTLVEVAEAQRLRRELEERLDTVRRAVGGASGGG
jgi:allophanate hydrolase subunit 2